MYLFRAPFLRHSVQASKITVDYLADTVRATCQSIPGTGMYWYLLPWYQVPGTRYHVSIMYM